MSFFSRSLLTASRARISTAAPLALRQPTSLFARFISDDTRNAIQGAIDSAPVVLFMKGTPDFPQCGFSRTTIQALGHQGVDPNKFAAFNVLEDQELRDGVKEFSQWPTIPQLYIKGEFVGGCDIVVEMSRSGELADLLEKENLLAAEEEEVEQK